MHFIHFTILSRKPASGFESKMVIVSAIPLCGKEINNNTAASLTDVTEHAAISLVSAHLSVSCKYPLHFAKE